MSNYIYKMVNKDREIIYIGKSIDLKQRINQHMNDKDWFHEVNQILYTKCKTQTDMDIYEIYYINKFKPKHNKASMNSDIFSLILPDLTFNEYLFEINSKNIRSQESKNLKLQFNTLNIDVNVPISIINNKAIKTFETYLYVCLKQLAINDELNVYTKQLLDILQWKDRKTLKKYLKLLRDKGYISFNFDNLPQCIFNINEVNDEFINIKYSDIEKIKSFLDSGKEHIIRLAYFYKLRYITNEYTSYSTIYDCTSIRNNCVTEYNKIFKENDIFRIQKPTKEEGYVDRGDGEIVYRIKPYRYVPCI
jgi:hypothetical protein